MPPAARLSDTTTHGSPLMPGPGAVTVLIGGLPAWRTIIDQHLCPAVSVTGADGVGFVVVGSPTVMIEHQMACRIGDIVIEKPGLALGPANPIVLGCMTVMIGEVGAAAISIFFQSIVDGVNQTGSTINCGNIVDAAIARLNGSSPAAAAPNAMDGSFTDIETRHNTTLQWGQSFQGAFDAVRNGGDGTVAVVGVVYSGGTASHVITMANRGGEVAILEGQDWGSGNPREVIMTPQRANQRYNADGGSNIGYGLLPRP